MDWRRVLRESDIFKCLRQNADKIKIGNDSKYLTAFKDSVLFVWNAYESCLLTANLKYVEAQSVDDVDCKPLCQVQM